MGMLEWMLWDLPTHPCLCPPGESRDTSFTQALRNALVMGVPASMKDYSGYFLQAGNDGKRGCHENGFHAQWGWSNSRQQHVTLSKTGQSCHCNRPRARVVIELFDHMFWPWIMVMVTEISRQPTKGYINTSEKNIKSGEKTPEPHERRRGKLSLGERP